MSSMLDIIAAMVIGGFLLLIAFTTTNTANRTFFNYNADAITQLNLTNLSNTMQYDLRKMGYGIPEALAGTIIQVGQPNHIKFLAHLNKDADCNIGTTTFDNIADTIEYTIVPAESIDFGDTVVTMYSVNRKVTIAGQSPESQEIGRIGNDDVFRYLDQVGNPVSLLAATKMVEITLTAFDPQIVLSPELFVGGDTAEEQYRRKEELRRLLRASYWRQTRLISRNLRR